MKRERIGRIGLASLLTLGSLAGVAGVAGAQSTDTTNPSSGQTSDRPQHRGPGLEAAAKALNLSEDELKAKLEDGTTTIAAVAAAQGVDVQTVIDAIVADATTHIDQKVADGDITEARATEIKANLTERITKMVNEGRPAGGPEGRGHGRPSLEAAAKALNLSEDELKTKLMDGGQTIAQVAKAQDVDVQKVIDAMVAEATANIDQKVKDGDITEAKATEIKSNLKERITKLVNDGPPARGEGRPEGGPDGGPPPADGDQEAPQS
jgi:ribosomal protein S20